MTIYKPKFPFDYITDKEYCGSCVDTNSESCVRVSTCIYECYQHFIGNNSYYPRYALRKYKHIDKNGNIVVYDYDPDYMDCMLDNFSSYYSAIKDGDYLTILSIGSSYTHKPSKHGWFNYDTMSEGFGVVINVITNDITLVTLGEDDGNYWGDHEIPYTNLSKYDRNKVISIVNNIDENDFWDKNKLIEKLWYNQL